MSRPAVDPTRMCQLEIVVSDLSRAVKFYSEAFGWEPVPAEIHELVVLGVPRDCPYGISLRPGLTVTKGAQQSMTPYFTVDDPESVLTKVVANGGKRVPGSIKLPGYGTVYLCEDPDGTKFGLHTKATRGPSA